jgi:hypothetical protein
MAIVAAIDATIVATAARLDSIGAGFRIRSTARIPSTTEPARRITPWSRAARCSAFPWPKG